MIEVQASFLVLQTVTEMQNDIGMTSEINIVYFWFISLFGNHFTKIQYKFEISFISFEKIFAPQTQSLVSDVNTCC